MSKMVDLRDEHPWGSKAAPGKWETRQYETESHMQAGKEASKMAKEGWSIWLVSNSGTPGFVVYRKVGR